MDEAWIAAAYTPPEQRPSTQEAIRVSDQLVDEFLADLYVIGIPVQFQRSQYVAYIDQIVRVGRTFAFEPENSASPTNPLYCRKMFIITARGDSGFEPGERNEKLNYQDPYLRTLLDSLASPTSPLFMLRMTSLVASLAQSIAAARTQVAH